MKNRYGSQLTNKKSFAERFGQQVTFFAGSTRVFIFAIVIILGWLISFPLFSFSSTWYPLADRNPQQFVDPYHCISDDLKTSEIRIYHDQLHPSSVVLPVTK